MATRHATDRKAAVGSLPARRKSGTAGGQINPRTFRDQTHPDIGIIQKMNRGEGGEHYRMRRE